MSFHNSFYSRFKAPDIGKKNAIVVLSILLVISLGLSAFCIWYVFNMNKISDGKIGVNAVAGKLKVDIVDSEGNSAVGQSLELLYAEGEAHSFKPGDLRYTESFRIKNCTDAAVKIIIFISADGQIEAEKLNEAFDIRIIKASAADAEGEDLYSFEKPLSSGETSDSYCLKIKMKDNAESGIQGMRFDSIGITVCAIPESAE